MRRVNDILTGQGTFSRFVRFILVGVANTAVGYLLFAVFVLLGMASQPALALAFVLGVMWNYWTHARLVFGERGVSKLPAYGLSYLGIWAVNALGLHQLQAAGFSPLISQAILAPVAAVLSFFLIARVLTGQFPLFGNPDR